MSSKYSLLEVASSGDIQAVEVCCGSRNKEKLFEQLRETSENGSTPLLAAAREGHASVVEMLLEAGADIQAQNLVEDTALHVAAFRDQVEVVRLLLEADCNIEVRLLLRRGASTAPVNSYGNSAMTVASNPIIKSLIQADLEGGATARAQILNDLDEADMAKQKEAETAAAAAEEEEKQRQAAVEAARARWDAEDEEEDRLDEEARVVREMEEARLRFVEEERIRIEEEERLRLEEEAKLAAIAAKKAKKAAAKAAKK